MTSSLQTPKIINTPISLEAKQDSNLPIDADISISQVEQELALNPDKIKYSLKDTIHLVIARLLNSRNPKMFFSVVWDCLMYALFLVTKIHWFETQHWKFYHWYGAKYARKYETQTGYDFNGIQFPKLDIERNGATLFSVLMDTFGSWLFNNGDNSEKFYKKHDKHSIEGLYLYKGNAAVNKGKNAGQEKNIDITIHEGDTVLDIGAWVGDFSVLSAVYGATAYAFEPSPETLPLLENTIELNKELLSSKKGKIIPVGLAAGNKNQQTGLQLVEARGGSTKMVSLDEADFIIETVKLDDWVKDNNIKVDFIKSDIEGSERVMLEGASWILKTQAPVLSICTYHYPEDAELLANIILKTNPEYSIVQNRMKLFAWVEK